ncbi:multidrug efflux pump RND permease subunit MdtB [Gammaproteobacteria bacterium]
MNPSRIFVLRPVATFLLALAWVLAGGLAYQLLPVSALPQVEYPTLQVVTLYPGASAEVMASSVTSPLERQFGQMPGLQRMFSTSAGDVSVIVLQFVLTLSLDVAEQQVQAAINAASSVLPDDLPSPPIYNKVNPADAAVLTLAVTSSTWSLPKVQDWVDSHIAQKISQISGVGLVSLSGGQRPAIRVQTNPLALAAVGLSLEEVRTAISNANAHQPKGGFDGRYQASSLDVNDQISSAEEYQKLVITYRNAAPVRLGEVASVVDGAENKRLAAWVNGSPAILVHIQRQPGANVIEVVDRIKQWIPQISLPSGIEVRIIGDRTVTVRASVADVATSLWIAVFLVVSVIFLFLGSFRATIIPAIAVPVSLVGTFPVLYFMNFSINNLTLMAMTIATGFVVDDAIVAVENISRHLRLGKSPKQAALDGSEEIGFTILSLTVSLVAVLIPLFFMGDIVGRLFREFAVSLAVSILVSAAVSLTLVPMMCARLLNQTSLDRESRFFQSVVTSYGDILTKVLQHPKITLLVAISTLGLSITLYWSIPKGLLPIQDTGILQGISVASPKVSFEAMTSLQKVLDQALRFDPAVSYVSSSIGVDGTNATLHSGKMQIGLRPMENRREGAKSILKRLQDKASQVTGITLYLQLVQDLTMDDQINRARYPFTLDSPDAEELSIWTPKFLESLQKLPALAYVTEIGQEQGLQAFVAIDRDTAGRLGVSISSIDNALYNSFGQRLASTLFTQSNQYRIVLEVAPQWQHGLQALQEIYVTGASGKPISLDSVAKFEEREAPVAFYHLGQFPVTPFSFELAPGHSLSEAVREIETAAANSPSSIGLHFQGESAAFRASLTYAPLLFLASILTMYIVLGVLYESYIHPVTILSTLPSAGVGALMALQLSGNELDIVAIIGILLLIGIVKKNGILMVDFALEAERKFGKTPQEAIFQASLLRFRPILMTTLAALFSALPLLFDTGVGAELRHPLGITLVGGLLVSQVLTLFTTPVLYLVFTKN